MISISTLINYTNELNILYVEDDDDIRAVNETLFEELFLRVDIAVDGVDGLRRYINYKKERDEYYDLVITDINMPNKDGLELIRDINELNFNQPIIVISAHSDSKNLISFIQLGVDGFILKPIDESSLTNTLYKICENILMKKNREKNLILQSKNANLGQMIDTIAHQWKQPLNSIHIRTSLIYELNSDKQSVDIEEIIKCKNDIQTQIEHLTQTVNEFRNFFRPETRKSVINFKSLVKKVLVLLKDIIIKYNCEVECNFSSCNDSIEVVENELKHVIINLIVNALEAFKKEQTNKVISISTGCTNGKAALEIEDNAGGIDEMIIDSIFDPEITTKKDGTGTGLYLAKMIVDKSGGEIKVANTDNGAKFTILLDKSKEDNYEKTA
jgi:signal transduction histidine kinase